MDDHFPGRPNPNEYHPDSGGYVALVPQLYWRLASDVVLPEDTPEGLQQAFGYMQRLDEPQAVQDAAAALSHLRSEAGTR